MKNTVVVSGVRTPIGSYGGVISFFSLADICTNVIKEALSRGAVPYEDVAHVERHLLDPLLGRQVARSA